MLTHQNSRDPALYYGFWGQCYNLYQGTLPHHGYAILASWCELLQRRYAAPQT